MSTSPSPVTTIEIHIWMCANPECPAHGSYYGSSSDHGVDLRLLKHRNLKGELTGGTRADCPECHQARKPLKIRAELP